MAASISPDNPPYLTLTISQALSLRTPDAPEPKQHDSVNSMLDHRAQHLSDQLAVGFTHLSPGGEWRCHTLTYAEIRTLSANLAVELQVRLPEKRPNAKSPNRTPLVAVLSPSGVDLFGHIVALWRLGYGVLCIAPGSPAEAIANLLRLTDTNVVLAHASQTKAAQSAVDAVHKDGSQESQTCQMLPDVLRFVDKLDSAKDSSNAGPDDVLVTMHTSGSSGLPKPIYQLHRFWTTSMVSAPGRELSAFTTTPLFHGGMSDLLRSIQAGSSIFFHPTADPGALSTSAICQAISACNQPISYFLSVPYILDMLYTDKAEEGRRMLSSMQLVSTGGAPLPQQLGDVMVQKNHIRLVSRLGSSECGFLMSSWRDFEADQDWNQLRIPDELGQRMIQFEPFDGGLYELVVTKEWPTKLVANRDDGSYATSDLYAKQEGKANTWRYDSRSDDTIVLVSGKKTTAPVGEQKLKACPLVSEAIVFGANRAILGALVFIAPEAVPEGVDFNDKVKIDLLQKLQPVLASINAASSPHAQLATEMVHLLPPSALACIPRASKGTLQRGRAYQHFSQLIDSIYVDFEEGRSLRINQDSGDSSKEALRGEELIRWLAEKVESINGKKLNPDTDLFVAGVDSIQSARIRAAIHQNVELGGRLLERNVVYEYPTLRQLSEHVEEVRPGVGSRAEDGSGNDKKQRELKLMRALVEKYTKPSHANGTEVRQPAQRAHRTQEDVENKGTLFVLTGVTGGLGAQILDQVLSQSQPGDIVVCLVRAKDTSHALKRVLTSLQTRRLTTSHDLVRSNPDRIRCLPSDLSRSDCGISDPSLLEIAGRSSRVVTIHSAWSVHFVANLSSFESENIAGLAHLIDLHDDLVERCNDPSASCFTFCSSVASILAAPALRAGEGVGGAVLDEQLSTDPEEAVGMGYARSKWVGEQIVAHRRDAASSSNSGRSGRSNVVRIGQLCSDTRHGVWNESEAWPILIQISQAVGCFPDLKSERLGWLSTDIAAKAVLTLATLSPTSSSPGNEEMSVYNLAQPTTTATKPEQNSSTWKTLHTWLTSSSSSSSSSSHCSSFHGLELDLVSPETWLQRVEDSGVDHHGLLPLWQKNFASSSESEPIRFNCAKALQADPAFRTWQDQGVTESLIQKTVQRWREIGFLK